MDLKTLPIVSLQQQEKLRPDDTCIHRYHRVHLEPEYVKTVDASGRTIEADLWDVYGSGLSMLARGYKAKKTNQAGSDNEKKPIRVKQRAQGSETARREAPNTGRIWELEDERVLLQMADVGRSWIAIALMLDRSEEEVKRRYSYLTAARNESAGMKGKGRVANTALSVVDEEESQSEIQSAAASAGTPVGVSMAADRQVPNSASGAYFEGSPHFSWGAASDTDPFVEGAKATAGDVEDPEGIHLMTGEKILNGSEAVLLTRLHDHFEAAKWVAVAAKFFDKTGHRIAPEVLRYQFELGR